ncbi:MAG: alpha/beta hydrolase [Betaproteobacteria bacterium]|nr:alpha/beta hydrolase [Betaproteobacteria bacterium]
MNLPNEKMTHCSELFEFEQCRIEVVTMGQGPLVIFLPSLGRDAHDFLPLASLMASQGCRVCLPFPRGTGKSTGVLEGVTLNDLADDICNVIRMEGKPAIVAGHAFGNWVARNLATRYPELVSAVVLLAAAHRNFPVELRHQIDLCMNVDLDPTVRLQALQKTFFVDSQISKEWLTGWHPKLAMAQRNAAKACPPSEWWHGGVAPILDVQAELDPFAPMATAFELQNELGAKRVSVVRIANASHALIPEQTLAVSQAMLNFIHKVC